MRTGNCGFESSEGWWRGTTNMATQARLLPHWDQITVKTIESTIGDFTLHDVRLETHPVVTPILGMEFENTSPQLLSREGTRFAWKPLKGKSLHEGCSPSDTVRDWVGKSNENWLATGITVYNTPYFGLLALVAHGYHFSGQDRIAIELLGTLIAHIAIRLNEKVEYRRSSLFDELGDTLRSTRQHMGWSQVVLAEKMNQSRIALSQWENGRQVPSLGPLLKWCRALGILAPTDQPYVGVVDISPRLLQLLKEDPKKLYGLSPSEFERFVAGRLDAMGFDVRLTGRTNQADGGIDLIAVPKIRTTASCLIAGQMKHHKEGRKAGRTDVDRLLAWKNTAFNLGLLVTNTVFTHDALWLAMKEEHRSFLRLRDFEDLKSWLQDNFTSEREWREIPEKVVLTPNLTIEIPRPKIKDYRS